MTSMKGKDAEETSVRSQLLIKATTYSAMANEKDWNNVAKCWDIASWTVFEEVVMRVETFPGLMLSTTVTG